MYEMRQVNCMINQERVREMSRMSMLESGLGEKELKISTYRRIDYVVLQMIKGFFAGTVCFAALFLLWFFQTWDSLNQYFADADFDGFIEIVLIRYGIFMAVYLALSIIVAVNQHRKCKHRKEEYLKHLNRLNKSYLADEEEEEV